MEKFKTEVRDGMRIDWDVPISMDDGLALRADIYRPLDDKTKYPAILTYGPYGKGLAFQEGYKAAWDQMVQNYPDVSAHSSNQYQNWETVDPEKWVPDGYVCVRVDSRGCGRSPGYVDHYSPRETKDFYNCIEWCAAQPWSDGKVGLNGISYYAINQWDVASLQPPHLTAMCIWEGAADWYRDMTHHGGIVSTFWAFWQDSQVKSVQYGLGERGKRSVVTGELVSGPETLSQEQLDRNRCKLGDEIVAHPLDDAYHQHRSPVYQKIKAPLLSSGNWGGQGLHLRGNVEGFLQSASPQKWLELHGREHWTEFYTDYGVALQKRFFDYFLKGKKNGWDAEPRVQLMVRHLDKFVPRGENEWPLARTRWTRFYLNPDDMSLSDQPVHSEKKLEYQAMGDGLTFRSAPLKEETEYTGPSSAKLFVSSATKDADIFVIFRVFAPDGQEVVFQGAIDPHTPVGQGWLRASHRKLDPQQSQPYRPYHTHDELQPLTPGKAVELDVEIWPTSIVVPAGYRVAFTLRGSDYEYPGPGTVLPPHTREIRGCGPFVHDEPRDRPHKIFGGKYTLHFGVNQQNAVLLPMIPPKPGK
jgi:predicted acyl esterase